MTRGKETHIIRKSCGYYMQCKMTIKTALKYKVSTGVKINLITIYQDKIIVIIIFL